MYKASNASKATEFQDKYLKLRLDYTGFPLAHDYLFDTELVSKIIDDLVCGKAVGLDGISSEHLKNCYPSISCILAKLFNLMLLYSYVPSDFGRSYIVPLPKAKEARCTAMSFADFRGIAISPILSKIFERCILDRFGKFFVSPENQFGFKKNLGCDHAIYTMRKTIDHLVTGGHTVNLCSIDLSKAFDKTNHHALFIKLIRRHLPVNLLDTLEYWLKHCWSCVKWFDCFSQFFHINFGLRQGSVLSPVLFAIYVDDILISRQRSLHSAIILYADDILLISPSLCELQNMFSECERKLCDLDMSINAKKSCCLRIGPRFDLVCCNIMSISGCALPWVTQSRYLGIYLLSSRTFSCSLDIAKRKYFRSLNSIFGKVGRSASEEVTLQLVSSKCLPILLYGAEVCGLKNQDIRSLDFVVNRFLMKLFKTNNINIIRDCLAYFNFNLPSTLLVSRYNNFMLKYRSCDNFLCKLVVKLTA